MHPGIKNTLSSLATKYWLINGIRELKKVIYKCMTCFKIKAKCAQQLMGSLPYDRVNFAKPFMKTEWILFWPFLCETFSLKRLQHTKAYVCLFICFSTKAIHLELCSDLTTENFLACFKRFISRRGLPSDIYCDNMSTYKGDKNELSKLAEFIKNQETVNALENSFSSRGINFDFIPSYSPTFGGLWEAEVLRPI